MASRESVRLYNVVINGVCFMLIFTAFFTNGNVQTSVLNNVVRDGKHIFNNTGYISLGINYIVFALANFISPSFIHYFGPRVAMICGAITYCLFIASIIYPIVATLYIASFLMGIGAAMLWTGQGNFLTLNSDAETINRNTSIFWALYQCSMLFGNLFVYFHFKGEVNITDHSRIVLYTVLTVCSGIGTLALFLLRKPPERNEMERDFKNDSFTPKESSQPSSNLRKDPNKFFFSFLNSFKLLFTKDMMLLSVTASYSGFELAFLTGVYGTSISNTSNLHDSHRQVGLMGILIGCGEISGSLLFFIFRKHTNRHGRYPIVVMGFIIHIISFNLIYLNVPDEATLRATQGDSWLNYNLHVYGLCAFLLGFGDSNFNTQIISILGTVYADDSSTAFSLYICLQSLCSGIAFAYGLVFTLKYQLLILVIAAFFGTASFIKVERKHALLKNLSLMNDKDFIE